MTKKLAAAACVALFATACADSPTAPDAGEALFSHGGSHSLHDLTTPVLEGGLSGNTVSLSWSPTDLQADCDAAAAANALHEDVVCWGTHFEIYRNGVQIAETASASYEDAGLADGSYTYKVKSKGMEGRGNGHFTHHSRDSNGVSFQVGELEPCAAPTVTLSLSHTTITTGGGSTTVTASGSTTNVVDCAGGELQWRLDDSRANSEDPPGGDHTVEWTTLSVNGDGSYSVAKDLRRANANRTYTFRVRVRNGDNPTWVVSSPAVVTVVPNNLR